MDCYGYLDWNANIDNNYIMENRHQQILSEIKSLMASVRVQLEQLDVKMAELQQSFEPQSIVIEPTDFSIDDITSVEGLASLPELQTVVEIEPVTAEHEMAVSEPEDIVPEQEAVVSDPEPVAEQETVVFDPVAEPEALVSEPEPVVFEPAVSEPETVVSEPEPVSEPVAKVAVEQPVLADKVVSRQAVIDAMASKQAWRTDMPGSPVRDVRAAIALVDRALFINTLFGEDAASFINAVNAVNQMTSLDEAVEYITENYPGWDMESDIVYRFMMAVRRKVN